MEYDFDLVRKQISVANELGIVVEAKDFIELLKLQKADAVDYQMQMLIPLMDKVFTQTNPGECHECHCNKSTEQPTPE